MCVFARVIKQTHYIKNSCECNYKKKDRKRRTWSNGKTSTNAPKRKRERARRILLNRFHSSYIIRQWMRARPSNEIHISVIYDANINPAYGAINNNTCAAVITRDAGARSTGRVLAYNKYRTQRARDFIHHRILSCICVRLTNIYIYIHTLIPGLKIF